jgi:uncharacterized membrane protein YkoI
MCTSVYPPSMVRCPKGAAQVAPRLNTIMTNIAAMAKITITRENIKARKSKMPRTKVAISNQYLLLVLSIAAIIVTCISFTYYINTAQAQTANQSSSSSSYMPTPSNASSGTTTKQQGSLSNSNLSNITGSIPLRATISGAVFSKVKTTLSDAVAIAQRAVGSNTSATLAFIRPLNGYLVYDVHVRNNSNNTTTAVIVDAGNGKVLYRQTPPSLVFGGFGSGHYGMFGKGKTGPFFGGHGVGRGFGDHSGGMMMGQSPRTSGGMSSSPPRW